ncbi:MAG: RluA family pseudouridine synthase [Candidatus Omnitrophota bacterium]
MENFLFTAAELDIKKRLDLFLVERLGGKFSRSNIQRHIEEGNANVNGQTAMSNWKLKLGDKIELTVPDPKKTWMAAENIDLNIVYEDEHLLVVDKPAGLVVHPAPGNLTGTLVNALLGHCKDLSGIGGELRPGIVHRLDKETSGLLVVAKDDYTHRKLSKAFKNRAIKRRYMAFVRGVVELDNGTINLPIGRHKRNRQKMAVVVGAEDSKEALTHYSVIKRYADYTMLELVLGTGRTHQIRTHLQYLGHPLLGDSKYGKTSTKIARHALHAATLGFKHPVTKKFLEFESELPEDMKKLL